MQILKEGNQNNGLSVGMTGSISVHFALYHWYKDNNAPQEAWEQQFHYGLIDSSVERPVFLPLFFIYKIQKAFFCSYPCSTTSHTARTGDYTSAAQLFSTQPAWLVNLSAASEPSAPDVANWRVCDGRSYYLFWHPQWRYADSCAHVMMRQHTVWYEERLSLRKVEMGKFRSVMSRELKRLPAL